MQKINLEFITDDNEKYRYLKIRPKGSTGIDPSL